MLGSSNLPQVRCPIYLKKGRRVMDHIKKQERKKQKKMKATRTGGMASKKRWKGRLYSSIFKG